MIIHKHSVHTLFTAIAIAFVGANGIGQIADTPDGEVAGIPANYTEAKAGVHVLPDPLVLAAGEAVEDERTWFEQRRPEIFAMIEANQYGRVPDRPSEMTFDVHDAGTFAFDGKALRKQVTIYFDKEKRHYLDLLVYLPAEATEPAPVLLQIGWIGNNLLVEDTGVKVGRRWNRETKLREPSAEGRSFGAPTDLLGILARGYAFAHFNYNDVEPDDLDGFTHGVRSMYKKSDDELEPDEWGAVAAWGWGISRVIDYFETDSNIDATRTAITGVSRLGKTVLWAGARDERVACVLASVSGSGGASLARRDYGERIAHLMAPERFPYWFAPRLHEWVGRMDEAPWDSHMIISLIAPRPVLLQTGYTDSWSDPYGEFLAAKAATPVFNLLGKQGIEEYSQPRLGEPMMNTLGYLMHDGGHGMVPEDWNVFLDFMDRHLVPRSPIE